MDKDKLKEEELKQVNGGKDHFYSGETYDSLGIKDFGPGQVGMNHPLVTIFWDKGCREFKRDISTSGPAVCWTCLSRNRYGTTGIVNYCKKRSREFDPAK